MKDHAYLPARKWALPLGLVALVGGPIAVYFVLTYAGLSAAAVLGVVILMLLKHLGLLGAVLGPTYGFFRLRRRRKN